MMITFSIAVKKYKKGLSVQSIATKKVYNLNGESIAKASKFEKIGFWLLI